MNSLIEVIKFVYNKNTNKQFNILQVGANNGIDNDPLFDFLNKNININAVLIEPIPIVFEKLKENYKNNKNNLIFLNCAILEEEKEIEMFIINEKYYTEFGVVLSGLTSIYKNHLRKHLLKYQNNYYKRKMTRDVNDYISSFKIKTKTFKNIIKEYHYSELDLLQIDTEGYDCKLIINYFKTVDILPKIINFENRHVETSDLKKTKEILINNNYLLFDHGGDTCAYKK